MSFTVAPIVEGHGDVPAVRVLIQRLKPALHIARPVRFPRSQLVIESQLIRAAHIAAANIRDRGAILLMLDADEDCAKDLAKLLQGIVEHVVPQHVCRAVLPVREFESWIVGGDPAYGVDQPDSTGDLKGRIERHRGVYKETVDQPKLTNAVDLDRLYRVSRSFRRMKKVIDEFELLSGQAE